MSDLALDLMVRILKATFRDKLFPWDLRAKIPGWGI